MATNKSSAGESLAGFGLVTAGIIGFILYMGANHGWDRHSFPITVPFFSGPSDKEIRAKLGESGWTDIEDIDRRLGVESGGDHNTRKGTQLYPARIKIKVPNANPASVALDVYFYRDDFGELRWYVYEHE